MMIKKITALSVLTLAVSSFPAFASSALTGCAAKEQNIQRQITEAKKYGNTHRVAGLEKAHSEVLAHCNDGALKKEREANVHDKEAKVAERVQELSEAKASGRSDKIAKKEKKLEEAREELREAQAELTK